jgi:hypothetical protein
LKLKVVELTQTRPTPFKSGVPWGRWWYWFKIKYLDLNIKQVEGLEVSRA